MILEFCGETVEVEKVECYERRCVYAEDGTLLYVLVTLVVQSRAG